MKLELETGDIQAIATTVVEMLKPFLKQSGRSEAKDIIFNVEGLAKYIEVDSSWVYKQVSLKTIPYFKIGKYPRFKKTEIDKWISNKTIMPIPSLKMVKNHR